MHRLELSPFVLHKDHIRGFVYDVTDGASPQPAGALPLPHFQNEDVSLGGDRLLISTDGQTGSFLVVVDISNPTTPVIERVIKMEILGEGHTASCIDAGCRWVWVAGDQTPLEDRRVRGTR